MQFKEFAWILGVIFCLVMVVHLKEQLDNNKEDKHKQPSKNKISKPIKKNENTTFKIEYYAYEYPKKTTNPNTNDSSNANDQTNPDSRNIQNQTKPDSRNIQNQMKPDSSKDQPAAPAEPQKSDEMSPVNTLSPSNYVEDDESTFSSFYFD